MKFTKIFIYLVIIAQLTAVPLTTWAYTPHVSMPTTNTALLRADDIQWQYKMINGVLHKRLYNFTTNKPLTDWTPVT